MTTVKELVEQLVSKCPEGSDIMIYYDGDARVIPDFAYQTKEGLVVLGEGDDIYWRPDESTVLFDIRKKKASE